MRFLRSLALSLAALALLVGAAAPAAASTVNLADPTLFADLHRVAPRLSGEVLRQALDAAACADGQGLAERDDVLTVIDYSRPSTEKRMWVFDLRNRELLWEELVAHGKNTGGNYAKTFSNVDGSKQSSLGLFRTGATYYGGNGYSLRMHGLEPGINDLAFKRLIVMHGADYVSEDFIGRMGRIGRSWGCPAMRRAVAKPVIDRIKGGSLVYAYFPDQTLGDSQFVRASAQCVGATGGSTVTAAK